MLVILSSHPIQYQAPLWQALARDGRVPFEVWYVTEHGSRVSLDREFGKAFKWDIDTLDGYPYRFLESPPGATPGSFVKCRVTEDLAARLRSVKAKALWIQGWQIAAYFQAAWAARGAGAELWLRAESNDLRRTPAWKRGIKRAVLSRLFRRVDRFLCIGRANRRLYEAYGARPERLYSTPYSVDNERFASQAAELMPQRDEMRRGWGIDADAFCVVFCGKFIPKKRPLDLVDAVRKLASLGTIPKIHLLFVGSGELGPALRGACTPVFDAEAGGLQARTPASAGKPLATFTGFLNQREISKAYVAGDCLVLPSNSDETWGLVVNEAMASGLPCAASRLCGCCEDLIAASWPNRAFECGDSAGLASAIVDMQVGDRSRDITRRVIAPASFGATVTQVVAMYSSLASQGPPDT